jgi:hypothetical protein
MDKDIQGFEYTFTVTDTFQMVLDKEGEAIVQQALSDTLREAVLVQKACLLEAITTTSRDELDDKKSQ